MKPWCSGNSGNQFDHAIDRPGIVILSEAKNPSPLLQPCRSETASGRHESRYRQGRLGGWGVLLLTFLLIGGCTPLDRTSETTSDNANEPAFAIVTVTIALSPTPRSSESRYVVQDGDTLSGIAEMFGVTWDAIIQANALQSQDAIFVGQELVIPLPATPEA